MNDKTKSDDLPRLRLTRERRRAVCVHEAGHAVMHALGGAIVYRVAVAPEGATDWQTTGRKGTPMVDLWGVCEPAGHSGELCIRWDAESGDYGADRRLFAELQRLSAQLPGGRQVRAETLRILRAHLCATLAGPAAEQLHLGEDEPWLDTEGEWGVWDDAKAAQCLDWLLPWRGEIEHLHGVTVAALRRPDVWACVQRVADELERRGDIEEGLELLLPKPSPAWPPSPRAKKPAPLLVVPVDYLGPNDD
jgi:hypothetical protein